MLPYLKDLLGIGRGKVRVQASLVDDDTTSPYTLTYVDEIGVVLEAQDGRTVAAPWTSIYVIMPERA